MKFKPKKIENGMLGELKEVSLETFKAFMLMATPVYLFLAKNQKYLPIKGPLSFFDSKELEKWKDQTQLYVHPFIEQVTPFVRAGESASFLFGARKSETLQSKVASESTPRSHKLSLPVATRDLNNALIKIVGPLWGSTGKLDLFFIVFLVEGILGGIDPELIQRGYERDCDLFERAVVSSALAVFLSMHVGWVEEEFLKHIRNHVYQCIVFEKEYHPQVQILGEVRDLVNYSIQFSGEHIEFSHFETDPLRVLQKIHSRIKRIQAEMLFGVAESPTLEELRGVCDTN